MNDKIVSALVSACGPIIAAIIAGAFSQDTKQTLLIFFCSIAVVLVGLLVYFSYKKNKKCSKLKDENDETKKAK